LGDLSPGFFESCEWHVPADGTNAIVMIFRTPEWPILFAHGDARVVEHLLDEIPELPAAFLHIQPEIIPMIQSRYRECQIVPMLRMTLDPLQFRPVPIGQPERLGLDNVDELRWLYADGEATGESPDFFLPSMVSQGIYFGIYEGFELAAAAGTHLIAPEEGVGALGNVYTRRDRRGRGYAAALTSAVTNELLRMQLPTIILSVKQHNAAAIHVYERLGFKRYCAFCEGMAK
jgi:GNAT superfamily N-acetyltransferase